MAIDRVPEQPAQPGDDCKLRLLQDEVQGRPVPIFSATSR